MPFASTYFFVAASIVAITLFVVMPLREKAMTEAEATIHAARNILDELKRFVREAWIAFTGSRAAWVGVIAALLPAGAYALSLALQSNLAVELGLNDDAIAQLNVACTLVNAVFCILGGWLSDRFGRRSTLALFVALTIVPTLWLAWVMWKAGWIMPVDINAANRPHPSTVLVYTFWAACIVYNVFQGLYYGIRAALFMDVTTPRVAATQFTAYMALMNMAISYSATWQGWAVEHWGYPLTLTADAGFGLVCLVCLPFMKPVAKPAATLAPGGAVPESLSP
jgi:MFS family permease